MELNANFYDDLYYCLQIHTFDFRLIHVPCIERCKNVKVRGKKFAEFNGYMARTETSQRAPHEISSFHHLCITLNVIELIL